jgi:flagellar P-ring protein precursor FlgI
VPPRNQVRLQLRQADFTTSARIAEAINRRFGVKPGLARAESQAAVSVSIPQDYAAREIEFLGEIERLTVEADRAARVVVNERTGTIVMGKEVRVSPISIMQGALTVEIQTSLVVSQPAPLSSGNTTVVPQTSTSAKEERARNVVLKEGATVEELVRALNAVGSTPRDIIAILQNLRAAGALEAELEVI